MGDVVILDNICLEHLTDAVYPGRKTLLDVNWLNSIRRIDGNAVTFRIFHPCFPWEFRMGHKTGKVVDGSAQKRIWPLKELKLSNACGLWVKF